jgi:hypothetical protein
MSICLGSLDRFIKFLVSDSSRFHPTASVFPFPKLIRSKPYNRGSTGSEHLGSLGSKELNISLVKSCVSQLTNQIQYHPLHPSSTSSSTSPSSPSSSSCIGYQSCSKQSSSITFMFHSSSALTTISINDFIPSSWTS